MTAGSDDAASRPAVVIGRVVKAHGIRGEVVVASLSDVPDRFAPGTAVRVGAFATTIVRSRPHQGRLLVVLDGVTDRTAAERLRGRSIEAPAVALDDSEHYYVHELVGLAVLAEDGRPLGEVLTAIELPDAAGYDLLEIRRADGSTWLLPAVDDYVEVDVDEDGRERLVVVDPPDGLVEDVASELEPSEAEPSEAERADEGRPEEDRS